MIEMARAKWEEELGYPAHESPRPRPGVWSRSGHGSAQAGASPRGARPAATRDAKAVLRVEVKTEEPVSTRRRSASTGREDAENPTYVFAEPRLSYRMPKRETQGEADA